MSNIKGTSAFPHPGSQFSDSQDGLTKRELFAAMFIPAIIEKLNFTGLLRKETPNDYDLMAKSAVEVADALIKALEVGGV